MIVAMFRFILHRRDAVSVDHDGGVMKLANRAVDDWICALSYLCVEKQRCGLFLGFMHCDDVNCTNVHSLNGYKVINDSYGYMYVYFSINYAGER